ncbi:unnamed protein product [Sphagnum balticum]
MSDSAAAESSSNGKSHSHSHAPLSPREIRPLGPRQLRTQPPSWSIAPPADATLTLTAQSADPINVSSRCTTFGRSDESSVVVSGNDLSRQHAAIIYCKHGYAIADLHSHAGTALNDTQLERGQLYALFDADRITFAKATTYGVTLSAPHKRTRDYNNAAVTPITQPRSSTSSSSAAPDSRSRGGHGVKRGRDESASAGKSIRASHILWKHVGSRNPTSHRQGAPVTRTLAEATAAAQSALETLKPVRDDINALSDRFAAMATAESDCSSFKRGGDLGDFVYERMQAPFSKAAFALRKGEISDVVQSDSGTHIIFRTK